MQAGKSKLAVQISFAIFSGSSWVTHKRSSCVRLYLCSKIIWILQTQPRSDVWGFNQQGKFCSPGLSTDFRYRIKHNQCRLVEQVWQAVCECWLSLTCLKACLPENLQAFLWTEFKFLVLRMQSKNLIINTGCESDSVGCTTTDPNPCLKKCKSNIDCNMPTVGWTLQRFDTWSCMHAPYASLFALTEMAVYVGI